MLCEVRKMSFGERLAKLRKDAGKSQEELANDLNVSRQAVSKWESNSSYPETDKIVAICKLFNCSMDELLGVKETTTNEKNTKNNIFTVCNKYFDMFLRGINMFYNMTFKQKLLCLFELFVYGVIIIIIIAILRALFSEVFTKIFGIIPFNVEYVLINIIDGIYIVCAVFVFVYAICRLYKVRYLDYYDENIETKKVVIESPHEKINLNSEKIIIRDPSNAYKPFNTLKNICKWILKFLASCILFCLIVAFVICIALFIIAIYFINGGPLIIYTGLGILGVILFIYIFIELFVKYIFNKKQQFMRLFVMFVISLLIVGIASGLFACEISTYTIISETGNYSYKLQDVNLSMTDNLILNLHNPEYVFENRDDILIEFYSNVQCEKQTVKEYETVRTPVYNRIKSYSVKEYYLMYNDSRFEINEVLNHFLDSLRNKEIVINDYVDMKSVVHISKYNYQKLKSNENELEIYDEMNDFE